MRKKSPPSAAMHKIGAVSSLSGVPTPTLRGWEVRYASFKPHKTQSRHRLYTDDDVLKATLLKRLTDQGHAISNIAALDTHALNNLLQQQQVSNQSRARDETRGGAVFMAVVGLTLAGRVESKAFTQVFHDHALRVTDIFDDLAEALTSSFQHKPQILLLRINSLHAVAQVEIHKLTEKCRALQVIVLYGFGQETIIQSMKRAGVIVRREPVSDAELADLINSVLLVDTGKTTGDAAFGTLIPPRKFNDETLARVARISTNVLCECPRHVAEIITQLASFEQYSHECLNKSSEDAHLHAYLSSVSGSARALFERALEMIAQHEGIELQDAAP
ncbi:MAG: MerR family transcriptional regulator [Betaproteobacteria bacterium]